MSTSSTSGCVLALDVGGKRIGVAKASLTARLPAPHGVIDGGDEAIGSIKAIIGETGAVAVVVGLPRGLEGQETQQTHVVRQFANALAGQITLPLYFQDEAVTSKQAEQELMSRGKPYQKGDIDALAATIILEDFLQEHPELQS